MSGRTVKNPDYNEHLYKADSEAEREGSLLFDKKISCPLTSNGSGCRNQSSSAHSDSDEIQSQKELCNNAHSIVDACHLLKHVFFCTECNSTFRRRGNLRRHEDLQVCIRALEKIMSFKRHSYFCLECSSKFRTRSDLLRHENFYHFKLRRHIFFCTECNKTFTRRSSLVRHENLNKVKKSFTCSECNGKFLNKCNLGRHKQLHLEEKKFVCSICKKKFANVYYLNVHLTSHNTEKNLKCESCGCMYKTKSGLNKHCRRKHS